MMDEPDVHEQLVNGPSLQLEQKLEDHTGHDERQQPGDDDEGPGKGAPWEAQAEEQRKGEADDELADQRAAGELEGMNDGGNTRRILEDEPVVGKPGERRREVGDRRWRGLLEAQHDVVDDRKREGEKDVQDCRRQKGPPGEPLFALEAQPRCQPGRIGRPHPTAAVGWRVPPLLPTAFDHAGVAFVYCHQRASEPSDPPWRK